METQGGKWVTPNVGRLMGMALKAVKNIRQPLWMGANEWGSGGCEDGDLVMFKNTDGGAIIA